MRKTKLLIALVALFGVLAVTAQMLPPAHDLPAAALEENAALCIRQVAPAAVPTTENSNDWATAGATPIGNGKLGAAIFGGVAEDTILLNEKTIWSGDAKVAPSNHAPSTTKMQLNLLRQRLEDAEGQALSTDMNAALKTYLTGSADTFGSYEELALLRLSETPLDDIAYSIKEITSNAGVAYQGDEGLDRLFDDNTNTKWCYPKVPTSEDPVWIEWRYGGAVTIDSYRVVTANDVPNRDPRSWALYGSATGEEGSYQLIDKQTNVTLPDARHASTEFTLDAAVTYQYFRLELYAIKGEDGHCQMSEFLLLGDFNRVKQTPTVDTNYTDYSRVLDLENGVATVTYAKGGVHYTREYFMSYPDNVFVMRISADKAGSVSQYIGLESRRRNGDLTIENGDTLVLTARSDDQADDGLYMSQRLQVMADGGTISPDNITLQVKNADSVTIIMTADTNYDAETDAFTTRDAADKAVITTLKAAVEKGYAALRRAHVTDYDALFGQVQLSLAGTTVSDKAIDTLLAGYGKQNTAGEDRYTELLYYQYGRYLLIASARDNALQAGSIWSWGLGDADGYRLSDVAAAAELAQTTGLSDENFGSYISLLTQSGYETAAQYHVTPDGEAVRGWTAYANVNLQGYTAPGEYAADFYSPVAGAALVEVLWKRYIYSADVSVLEKVYPTMVDAALFWVDNLWTQQDGTLVANPSWSPTDKTLSLGSVRDQATIAQLFETVQQAAAVLGKQKDVEIAEICAAAAQLKTPETITAADISSSATEQFLFCTQNGDAAAAYALLQKAIGNCHHLLTDGEGSVQGHISLAAGLTELLLQSNEDGIRLLPALPRAWASGSVLGLQAFGGATLNMAWEDGRLTTAELAASRDGKLTLLGIALVPGGIVNSRGKAVAFKVDGDAVTFTATAGETYTLITDPDAVPVSLLGDVDGNDKVNTTDARLTLQFAAGRIDESELDTSVADVDGNDKVNTTDARLILQKAAGRIDEFPAENK